MKVESSMVISEAPNKKYTEVMVNLSMVILRQFQPNSSETPSQSRRMLLSHSRKALMPPKTVCSTVRSLSYQKAARQVSVMEMRRISAPVTCQKG